jgi:tripartite-type tricarboxylate transporter receptor subunit TctC
VPGYQAVAWYGLVAPKNLPPEILKRISDEVMRATASPGVRSVVAASGGEIVGNTPPEFTAFVAAERQRYQGIVSEAGMTVD